MTVHNAYTTDRLSVDGFGEGPSVLNTTYSLQPFGKCIWYIQEVFNPFLSLMYLQLIATESKMQISSVKTKYLAPFHFADTVKISQLLECPKKLII